MQHDILLKKLAAYGVRGVAQNLITSYLSNRYQYVCVDNLVSQKLKVECGVPQGSILGPLLFLVYINDITSIPNSPEIIMYADDTNIFFTGTTKEVIESSANSYLLHLSRWLKSNRLSLNTSKTKYIIFKPANKRDPYCVHLHFEDTLLEQVTEQKFLGVWFTEDLTWNTHVDKLKVSYLELLAACIKYKIYYPPG